MAKLLNVSALGLAALAALAAMAAARAGGPKADAKADHPLVGTWRCVSAKYNGQPVQRPAGFTQLKHVTPTQFMWATYDGEGKVHAALGGGYSLKGDDYVETPEYGVGTVVDQLKGKPQAFKW